MVQNLSKNEKINTNMILFFDMDGTLVDTNLANFLSYKKAMLTVTKSDFNLTYNHEIRFNRNNLKNIVPNLSENEYERIIQKKKSVTKIFCPKLNLINPYQTSCSDIQKPIKLYWLQTVVRIGQ